MLIHNFIIITLWIVGALSDSLSEIIEKRTSRSTSPLISGLMARSLNELLTVSYLFNNLFVAFHLI